MNKRKYHFFWSFILLSVPFFAVAGETKGNRQDDPVLIEGQRHELGGRGRILDDVVVVEDGDTYIIDVAFSQFFRYVWHTPKEKGNSLTIMIEPALTSRVDQEALSDRAVISPAIENFPITEIMYEGISRSGFKEDSDNALRSRRLQNKGAEDGPFLVFQFNKKYEIEVIQEAGFRSLTVKIK